MTRRCSHCGHNGHNSRTCPNRGVKLFGVRLTDGSIRKSASMGNLTHYMAGGGGGSGSATPQNGAAFHDSPSDTPDHPSAGSGRAADGYASEDFVTGSSSSSSRERKKAGVPWKEEEHRMFLLGLQKLGKGDWRGISRGYVMTRTPTQVASHAQKYFIRQSNVSTRKRRSSLFDIVPDDSMGTAIAPKDFFSSESPLQTGPETAAVAPPQPPPELMLEEEESESMASANSIENEPALSQYPYPYLYPAYLPPPFFPVPLPIWPAEPEPVKEEAHELVRPLAVHSKGPINVDELVSMSKLSLGESGPSMLSLRLVEGSSRPSAFHANPSPNGSGIDSNETNTIRAV